MSLSYLQTPVTEARIITVINEDGETPSVPTPALSLQITLEVWNDTEAGGVNASVEEVLTEDIPE